VVGIITLFRITRIDFGDTSRISTSSRAGTAAVNLTDKAQAHFVDIAAVFQDQLFDHTADNH
jgi:hypothetical protein